MSRGLTNQITSKELFTSSFNDRTRDSHQDSAYSNSQNTQFPYSQFAEYSQDVYSQNSGGSQTEVHGQSMFQRYMGDGQSRSGSSKLSQQQPTNTQKLNYQQQIELNKMKIKEKEEKDVLKNIANTVKGCSDEVKTILDVVESNIGEKIKSTQENIGSNLKIMLDDLNGKYEIFMKSLKGMEEEQRRLRDLEVQIVQRDNKLDEIENSLQNLQKKQERSMEKTVRNILDEYHSSVINELSSLKNNAVRNMDDFKGFKISQDKQIMKQEAHLQDFSWENQKRFQDLEKRITDSISMLQQQFDMRKYDTEHSLRQQLKEMYQNQFKDLESTLQQIFSRNGTVFRNLTEEIAKQQRFETKEFQRQHMTEMKNAVKTQISQEFGIEGEKLQKTIVDLEDKFRESHDVLHSAAKEEKYTKHMENLINECQFSIREDLKALHERHVQELEEIKHLQQEKQQVVNELKEQNSSLNCQMVSLIEQKNLQTGTEAERNNNNDDSTRQNHNNKNHYSLATSSTGNNIFKPRGQSIFVSPLHVSRQWTSKTLFSKPNPSPVATVIPQRHVFETEEVKAPIVKPLENEITHSMAITTTKQAKKRKKKRSVWSKKKKVSKTADNLESVSRDGLINKTNQNVFSDNEEDNAATEYNEHALELFSMSEADKLSFHQSQRSICDEDLNRILNSQESNPCDSRDSSPSLSVTEVIIKRRLTSRLQKQTPESVLFNDQRKAGQIIHKQDTMYSTAVRRNESKRKLCDQDFDTTMVEFAHSVRQHQRKK